MFAPQSTLHCAHMHTVLAVLADPCTVFTYSETFVVTVQVEKVMFEAAQSREEYYKLLAQKIYLIRKELEDRKRNKTRGTEIETRALPTLVLQRVYCKHSSPVYVCV